MKGNDPVRHVRRSASKRWRHGRLYQPAALGRSRCHAAANDHSLIRPRSSLRASRPGPSCLGSTAVHIVQRPEDVAPRSGRAGIGVRRPNVAGHLRSLHAMACMKMHGADARISACPGLAGRGWPKDGKTRFASRRTGERSWPRADLRVGTPPSPRGPRPAPPIADSPRMDLERPAAAPAARSDGDDT